MICKRLIIILLAILPIALTQTNYCDRNLCEPGERHVACYNNGAFKAACGRNPTIITITTELREQILTRHNEIRNEVAKGFSKFQPAARMATMRWSPELAKLAEFNVIECVMKHDQCHNTNEFKFSGQNLAIHWWIRKEMTIPSIIDIQIQKWFNEHNDCTVDYINKYPEYPSNGKMIGHFTALVQDKSTHVGCAILKHIRLDGYTEQLMACNYAYTNFIGAPVYIAGRAASQCKTGVNPNYKFLCSENEEYDVNVPFYIMI